MAAHAERLTLSQKSQRMTPNLPSRAGLRPISDVYGIFCIAGRDEQVRDSGQPEPMPNCGVNLLAFLRRQGCHNGHPEISVAARYKAC